MFLSSRNPDQCLRVMSADPDRFEFVEFSCLYPSLEPFYMNWEKDMGLLIYGNNIMRDYYYTPFIVAALYGISIYFGRKYMANREPFQWRTALAYWNLFLCIYSFMGLIRIAPPLIHHFTSFSFRDNLCTDPIDAYSRGSTGFWGQTFVWSKFIELIDTFFIIIHKKPLIFLHWYHHITVLLYTWDGYVIRTPLGPVYMAMNCAVHFIMYGYYYLMTIKKKPRWMNPLFITMAQLAQMVGGVFLISMTFYYYFTMNDEEDEKPCFIEKRNLTSALVMYGSYFCLFAHFFVRRYIFGKKSSSSSKAKMKKIE